MKNGERNIYVHNPETDWRHLTPERIAFWTIVALVILVPLGMHLGMCDTFDLPKWTGIYFGCLILCGCWFMKIMRGEEIEIFRTPLDLPMGLLILVMALSTAQSIDKSKSLFGAYRYYTYGLIPTLFTFLLYWMTVQFLSRDLRQKNSESLVKNPIALILGVAIFAGALVSIYGILQYFGISLFKRMPSAKSLRIWSTLGNPLWLGAYLAMLVPVAIHKLSFHIHSERRQKSILSFWILCSLSLLACFVLTLARGAWLAFILGMTVYIFKAKKFSRPFLPCSAIVVLLLGLSFFTPARERVLTTFREDLTNLGRVEGWKIGFKVLRKRPFLGTGPDTFSIAFRKYKTIDYIRYQGQGMIQDHAHNDIIQWATTTGFMGLFAYLWLWIEIFSLSFQKNRAISDSPGLLEPSFQTPLLSSLIILFVQNQFNIASASVQVLFAVFSGIFVMSYSNEDKLKIWKLKNPFSHNISQFFASVFVIILCIAGYFFIKPFLADITFQNARGLEGADPLSAVQQLESAISLNSNISEYENELGNLCMTMIKKINDPMSRLMLIKEAVATYQMNLNAHPYDADAYANMGSALMWMTQLGEDQRGMASKCFEKATDLDPACSEFWAQRAKVEHYMGNLKGEILFWQKVLELDPNHSVANQVLPQLLREANENKQK